MQKQTHIKDHNKEKELFLSRVIISSLIGVLLIAVIVIRLVQLQIIEYNLFSEKAQGNRINMRATLPPRGLIFDRNGKILAENITAFQLDIIPEQMQENEQTLTRLADLKLIKEEDIESINKKIKRTQAFSYKRY